ncbi:MAG: ParB/RepB/Spo0J family partition protein [Sulfitobacter sp.]|nr:ParB/RepB/Spo0J family partition protein [Sulfitobacter sp.]
MTAMTDQSPITAEVQLIPIAALEISPFNTRQAVPDVDIIAMAHSIAINGLMQNLSGMATEGGTQIVAGGKRLRALRMISENPATFPTDHTLDPVPVRVTTDPDTAAQWAVAENEARSDPHPADQIRAYRDMALAGADPGTIARAFAKTEAHVRGRLKLSELPETALVALERGQISLDNAKTLTLARSKAQLDDVLDQLARGRLHPNALRRVLIEDRIPASDRRAVFVGIETYKAEGGALTEDLFEGETLLHDEVLLQRLFMTKLTLKSEEVKEAEGWSWAGPVSETYLPYGWHDTHQRLYRTSGELTEADSLEYDRLAALLEADSADADQQARIEELQSRLDGDFTEEDRAHGGVFVLVNREGDIETHRAFKRRADSEQQAADDGSVEITASKPKPPITGQGTDNLHRIATLAAQTAALDKPELLLDLLAFQMVDDHHAWAAPMNIQVTDQQIEPSEAEEVAVSERLTATSEDLPGDTPADRFAAFQALGKKHRNGVLTRHLARAINAPFRGDFGRTIFGLLGADMRRVWTPTAANFFASCSVPMLDATWAEVLELADDDARRDEFGRMKKGEKAKALEALFSDASVQEAHGLSRDQVKALHGWVPEDFRLPERPAE